MAIGGGRSGGLSLAGRVDGSSRSKSPGSCTGSSGDRSSGVYCGGGPEFTEKQTNKKNNQSVSQSIYHTHKLTMIFFSVFYVVYGDPINTARF